MAFKIDNNFNVSSEEFIGCLICFQNIYTKKKSDSEEGKVAEAFSNCFDILCKCMKWKSPSKYRFDFQLEFFPFCKECVLTVVNLYNLNEELLRLRKQMNLILSTMSVKIFLSYTKNEGDNLMGSKNFSPMSKVRSTDGTVGTKEKINYFRNLIYRQYSPSVKLSVDSDDHCWKPKEAESFNESDSAQILESEEDKSLQSDPNLEAGENDHVNKDHERVIIQEEDFERVEEENQALDCTSELEDDYEPEDVTAADLPDEIYEDGFNLSNLKSESNDEENVSFAQEKVEENQKSSRPEKIREVARRLHKNPSQNAPEKVGENKKSSQPEKNRKVPGERMPFNSLGDYVKDAGNGQFLFDEKSLFECNPKLNKCVTCDLTFQTLRPLKDHLIQICPGDVSNDFIKTFRISQFTYGQLNTGEFQCSHCKYLASSEDEVKLHVRKCHQGKTMTPKTPYYVEMAANKYLCNHKFLFEKEDDQFKCGTCAKDFSSISHIITHIHMEHQVGGYQNKLSVYESAIPGKYVSNGKFVFEKVDNTFKCSWCCYSNKNILQVKRHIKGHLFGPRLNYRRSKRKRRGDNNFQPESEAGVPMTLKRRSKRIKRKQEPMIFTDVSDQEDIVNDFPDGIFDNENESEADLYFQSNDVSNRSSERLSESSHHSQDSKRSKLPGVYSHRLRSVSKKEFLFDNKYSLMKDLTGLWKCGTCGKTYSKRQRMLKHIIKTHTGTSGPEILFGPSELPQFNDLPFILELGEDKSLQSAPNLEAGKKIPVKDHQSVNIPDGDFERAVGENQAVDCTNKEPDNVSAADLPDENEDGFDDLPNLKSDSSGEENDSFAEVSGDIYGNDKDSRRKYNGMYLGAIFYPQRIRAVSGNEYLVDKKYPIRMESSGWWTCGICDQTRRQKRALLKHVIQEHMDDRFKLNDRKVQGGECEYSDGNQQRKDEKHFQLESNKSESQFDDPVTLKRCSKGTKRKQEPMISTNVSDQEFVVNDFPDEICNNRNEEEADLNFQSNDVSNHISERLSESNHQSQDSKRSKLSGGSSYSHRLRSISKNEFLFDNKYSLTKDLTGLWKCGTCGEIRPRRDQTLRHIIEIHSEGVSTSSLQYIKRVRQVDENKFLFDKIFPFKKTLEGQWICEVCETEFQARSPLYSHMIESHTGPLNESNDGNFVYKMKYPWARVGKELSCGLCENKFRGKTGLVTHFRQMHKNHSQNAPEKVGETKKSSRPEKKREVAGEVSGMPFHTLGDYVKDAGNGQFLYDEKSLFECNQKWNKCVTCDLTFQTLRPLKDHLIQVCPGDVSNDFIKTCRIHQFTYGQLKTGEFQCSHCKYLASSEDEVKLHIKKCHLRKFMSPKTPYYVEIGANKYLCNHKFLFEKEGDQFKCATCAKDFASISHIVTHIHMEHSLGGGQKTMNSYESAIPGKYVMYGKFAYEKVDDTLKCCWCSHTTKNIDRMKKHVKNHLSKKATYTCEICGKTFLTGSSLRIHLDYHKDEKSFVCEICGNSYTTKNGLCHHKAMKHVETSKNQYKCEICSRSFGMMSRLKQHLKSHERVVCEICGKVVVGTNIRPHNLLHHSGNKLLKCPKCYIRCGKQTTLEKHLEKHSQMIVCDICGKEVGYFRLKSHKRVHEGRRKSQVVSTNNISKVS